MFIKHHSLHIFRQAAWLLPTLLFLFLLLTPVHSHGRAELFVLTSPPNAKVFINDQEMGERTPSIYSVPSGEVLNVRIELEGYRPVEKTVESIAPGRDEILDLENEPLQPLREGVLLSVVPGTRVYFELGDRARFVTEADSDGKALIPGAEIVQAFQRDGDMHLLLRKDGYQDAREIFSWRTGDSSEITIEQVPQPAIVSVRSQPSGATVRLGGETLGYTPLDWETTNLNEDLYLNVELSGYEPGGVDVLPLSPGERRNLSQVMLEPLPGSLRMNFMDSSGRTIPSDQIRDVQVFVNGQLFTLSGTHLRGLGLGRSQLIIEHQDFLPLAVSVNIEDGVEASVDLTLEVRPATVIVKSTPPMALQARLNGETVALLGDRLFVPPGENHVIEISAPGQVVQRFELDPLLPNEETTLSVQFLSDAAPPPAESLRNSFTLRPGIRMIWVDEGEFLTRRGNEDVTIMITRGFWMSEREITQAQYQAVMGTNPSRYHSRQYMEVEQTDGRFETQTVMEGGKPRRRRVWVPGETSEVARIETLENHPVEMVSWTDAQRFAERLLSRESNHRSLSVQGYTLRLPTEAEWEYVSRAGRSANFSDWNVEAVYAGRNHAPVGSKPANPWGFRDLFGNVAEWCYDSWGSGELRSPVINPVKDEPRQERVVRGGHFREADSSMLHPARREYASAPSENIGFRIVYAPEVELLPLLGVVAEMDTEIEPQETERAVGGSPSALPNEVKEPDPVVFYSLSELDRHPSPLRTVEPQLRRALLREFDGQIVRLMIWVQPDGQVMDARISDSPDSRLNEPMVRAVRRWLFEPPLRNGKPVYLTCPLPVAISASN